jgi:hypothetical protein
MAGTSHTLAFETRQETFTALDRTQSNGHTEVSLAFQETTIYPIVLSEVKIGIHAAGSMPWFKRILTIHTPKHG